MRLRLIGLLAKQAPGSARCVGSLARALNTTAPNISQHLRVLKELGLVKANRRGYRIHYYLVPEMFTKYEQINTVLLGNMSVNPSDPISMEETTMCCKKHNDCIHPDQKPDPKDCTPEQIRECHGEDAKHHKCEEKKA